MIFENYFNVTQWVNYVHYIYIIYILRYFFPIVKLFTLLYNFSLFINGYFCIRFEFKSVLQFALKEYYLKYAINYWNRLVINLLFNLIPFIKKLKCNLTYLKKNAKLDLDQTTNSYQFEKKKSLKYMAIPILRSN